MWTHSHPIDIWVRRCLSNSSILKTLHNLSSMTLLSWDTNELSRNSYRCWSTCALFSPSSTIIYRYSVLYVWSLCMVGGVGKWSRMFLLAIIFQGIAFSLPTSNYHISLCITTTMYRFASACHWVSVQVSHHL